MKLNHFDRVALVLAAIFLGIIALRPLARPEIAQAQETRDHLYIEPGIYVLRSPDQKIQTQGKVVLDLNTGNIWGFPTSQDTPYLIDPLRPTPLLSSPIFLGKFDLAAMHKNGY